MVNDTLDIGLECYRTDRVAQHYWLGPPLGNMLERAWEALSKDVRTSRVFDLLTAPIVGLDNFAAGTNCPDPGDFIGSDDLPSERTSRYEKQYQEVVSLLIRGLLGSDDARKRATFRLIPLVTSHSLTNKDSSAIANALWSNSDPILHNSSGPNSPLERVYFILPEMEEGEAERSFRLKWLTSNPESQAKGLDYSSNMLAQVGAAVSGLRGWGRPLVLSTEDEEHIATHIENEVEKFSSRSVSFSFGIRSTIMHVSSVAAEITVPEHIAENLFRRVEFMLGTHSHSKEPLLAPVNDIRLALGFAVIPGLVRAMPDRFEDISLWLRTGLASEDDTRVRGTMAAKALGAAERDLGQRAGAPWRGDAVILGDPGPESAAYSPDFNPDEAVWGWVRQEVTGNLCLGSKAAVQERVNNSSGPSMSETRHPARPRFSDNNSDPARGPIVPAQGRGKPGRFA